MKTLFKLFIIAAFSVISTSGFSQSNIQQNKGNIVEMTPESITIRNHATNEIITAHLWNRKGAIIEFKVGDDVSYIIVDLRREYPFRYVITEIMKGK